MTRHLVLLALLMASLLAGCSDDTAQAPEAPGTEPKSMPDPGVADPDAAPSGPTTLTYGECAQHHLFYEGPASSFIFPDDFTPVSANGLPGMVTLVSYATICQQGPDNATAGEYWNGLMVQAPEPLPDGFVFDLLLIGITVTSDDAAAAWASINATANTGTVSQENSIGVDGNIVETVAVRDASGRYDLQMAYVADGTTFGVHAFRMWVPDDTFTTIVGRMSQISTEAPSLGNGAVVFRATGTADDTPPGYVGLAHRVGPIGSTQTFEPAPFM